jgi:hypothetical protein
MSTTNPVLPLQAIDFTVPNPSASAQLSLPLYQGAGYRADFKTWALLQDGGFMKFNLNVSQPIPVQLVATLCASLVGGQANCPISITVNGQTFVPSYADTNPNFHPVTWTIPQTMIVAGNNTIVFTLLASATTQLFMNYLCVSDAVLPTQGIDFSVPNPAASAQLSLPLYQGAGYRADFKTWALLESGGFMKFNLLVCVAIRVDILPNVCASLVGGKANCPISVTVNGQPFVPSYADTNPNFHPVKWVIPQSMITAGNNTIVFTLLPSATTQLFINYVTVSG